MSRAEAPTKPSGIPWLGEVPAHWEVKRADAVLEEQRTMIGPEVFVGQNVFHYSIPSIQESGDGAVEEGETIASAKTRITRDVLLVSKLNPRKGTVLIGRPREELTVCSGEFVPLVPIDCDLRYAEYVYRSEQVRQQLDSAVKSVTRSHQRAASEDITKVKWAWPDIPEQRAIAAFLDERTARIDGLLARKQRLVQLLKEKRQALITRAVTRGLDANVKLKESGVPWLGEVPEHWGVAPVRHIAESIQTGPFGTQLHEKDYVEGGIPLINPAHLIQGRIVPDGESAVDEATRERLSRYVLQAGDILFARRGDIGRSAMVADDQDGWMCGTGSMRVRLSNCDPRYYAVLFNSQGFAEALSLHAVGTTMLNINPTILSRQFVPRPPMNEQVDIRDYIETTSIRIDALITKVDQAVLRLQEYRTALISAAVTGKVRVLIGRSEDRKIRQ